MVFLECWLNAGHADATLELGNSPDDITNLCLFPDPDVGFSIDNIIVMSKIDLTIARYIVFTLFANFMVSVSVFTTYVKLDKAHW